MSRLVRSVGREQGYSIVDVLMGLLLSSLVLLTVYRVFLPTLALSRNTDDRLNRQQDVRLVVDRLARDLRETRRTTVTVYASCPPPAAGQSCIGYSTARYMPGLSCFEDFQVVGGFPHWTATLYVWLDAATRQLHRACDVTTAIPASTFPIPSALTQDAVIGREIVEARFTWSGLGIEIFLREQGVGASRPTYRYQTEFQNQTLFVPQN